jgi:hypothetical protein
MKLSSVFLTALSTFAVIGTALGFSSQAQALSFSGISSGTWGEPTPGSINTKPVFTGVNTNSFTWGQLIANDPRFNTPPNQLTFTGKSFSAEEDSLFKIGDLTYFNGTVPLGTNVDSVPLNLHVSFKDLVDVSEVFNFDFHLVNTPNLSKNPWDNADYVYPQKNFGDRSFSYAGKKYTLELIGFSQDDGVTSVSKFGVLEGEKTTAAIFAKITQIPEPKQVPEPGAIAGLSLLGVYLISRKKSSNNC